MQTPGATWRERGEADPHETRYDCERAKLAMGNLTDDELANAMFLCDHRTSFDSIAYLTAAKDRIRWLSRRLAEATAVDAARLEAWGCALPPAAAGDAAAPAPTAWICDSDLAALAATGEATVYAQKQVWILAAPENQTALYAAAPPAPDTQRYLTALQEACRILEDFDAPYTGMKHPPGSCAVCEARRVMETAMTDARGAAERHSVPEGSKP